MSKKPKIPYHHPLHQLKWRFGIDGDVNLLKKIHLDLKNGVGKQKIFRKTTNSGVREGWIYNLNNIDLVVIYKPNTPSFPAILTFKTLQEIKL